MFHLKMLARVSALVAMTAPFAGGFVAPAAAQYSPYPPPPRAYYGMIAPQEADAVVRSLGLTPVAPPRPYGPVFVVHALGQEGSQIQVTLDRRTGRVRRIIRVGQSAPRVVTLPPDARPYDPRPPMPEYFDEEDEAGLPPRSGPRVITREGIEVDRLPPPDEGPRVVMREPDVTGSVPRAAPRGPADPLLGVPQEFRDRQGRTEPARPEPRERLAARTPNDGVLRVAPLPRPRPVDAPAVAQKDEQKDAPPPAAKQEPPQPESPAAKPEVAPEDVPDAQGFE